MFTTNCASVSPLPPRTRLNTAHPQKPLAVRHFQYITVGRRWNRNTVFSGGDSATTEAYDAITIESGLGRSPQPGGVFENGQQKVLLSIAVGTNSVARSGEWSLCVRCSVADLQRGGPRGGVWLPTTPNCSSGELRCAHSVPPICDELPADPWNRRLRDGSAGSTHPHQQVA